MEKKWLRDREKKFIADLEQEKRRSEALLLNILPQKIVDRIRDGKKVIADRILEATILFCDLVGFTTLSQELPADRLIDFLSKIFSAFDHLAAEQGVEKPSAMLTRWLPGSPKHNPIMQFELPRSVYA